MLKVESMQLLTSCVEFSLKQRSMMPIALPQCVLMGSLLNLAMLLVLSGEVSTKRAENHRDSRLRYILYRHQWK